MTTMCDEAVRADVDAVWHRVNCSGCPGYVAWRDHADGTSDERLTSRSWRRGADGRWLCPRHPEAPPGRA